MSLSPSCNVSRLSSRRDASRSRNSALGWAEREKTPKRLPLATIAPRERCLVPRLHQRLDMTHAASPGSLDGENQGSVLQPPVVSHSTSLRTGWSNHGADGISGSQSTSQDERTAPGPFAYNPRRGRAGQAGGNRSGARSRAWATAAGVRRRAGRAGGPGAR